jgi:hypothetical protein
LPFEVPPHVPPTAPPPSDIEDGGASLAVTALTPCAWAGRLSTAAPCRQALRHAKKWGIARQTTQPHGVYNVDHNLTYWGCGSPVCRGSTSADLVTPNASRIPCALGQARDMRLLLPKGRVRRVANLALRYVLARRHSPPAAIVRLGVVGVNGTSAKSSTPTA